MRHDKGREYSRIEEIGIGRRNVVFADGHCEFVERRVDRDESCMNPFFRGRSGP